MTAAKGFVIPAGGGKRFDSPTPGRSFALKLLGRETGESIMMFEETLPAGTASLHHLHHDSDEVAWVLSGEFTFKIGDEVAIGGPGTCAFMPRNVPHAWKNTGRETGRVLFLYTPAASGEHRVASGATECSGGGRHADRRRTGPYLVGRAADQPGAPQGQLLFGGGVHPRHGCGRCQCLPAASAGLGPEFGEDIRGGGGQIPEPLLHPR